MLPTYLQNDYRYSDQFNGASRLVLGCAGIGGAWGKVDPGESVDTLLYALENGVSVLDTAAAYAESEVYVGQALQRWKGNRPFVSTKAGKLKSEAAWIDRHDFSPAALWDSVHRSQDLLGIATLDLLFLHEPHVVAADKVEEVVETLLHIKAAGLTRMLGLGGNLDEKWMEQLPKQHFDVVMEFNRLDACNLAAAAHELPLIRKAGVKFYAASLLHMGLLGNRFEASLQQPPPWVNQQDLNNAVAVNKIAKKNGLPLPTLAHRFAFSMAEADRVVIGARNLSQLKASLADWQAGPLPQELFNEICASISV